MIRQEVVIILLGIVAGISLLRLVTAALHKDGAGRRSIRIPRPGEWDALTWLILPLPLLAGAGLLLGVIGFLVEPNWGDAHFAALMGVFFSCACGGFLAAANRNERAE